MVFLLALLGAYICIGTLIGLRALIVNNNSEAPIFQLTFAIVLGLSWPLKLVKN